MDAKYQKYYNSLKGVDLGSRRIIKRSFCDTLISINSGLETMIATSTWTEKGASEIKNNVLPTLKSGVNTFKSNVSVLSQACSMSKELVSILESLEDACKRYNSCPDDLEHQALKSSYRNSVVHYEGLADSKIAAILALKITPVNVESTATPDSSTVVSGLTGLSNYGGSDFVNYYQGNYKQTYGYGKTIAQAGCGPTSVAMVLTNMLGKEITPIDTAQYSMDHGYRIKNNGTSESLFPAMAKEYGLNCEKSRHTADNIIESLKEGKVIIAHMGKGHFTKGGHYIVLRGIDENGKVIVSDPASKDRPKKTWDASLIANESKGSMYIFS